MRLHVNVHTAIGRFGRFTAIVAFLLHFPDPMEARQKHPIDRAMEGTYKCGILGPALDTFVVGGQRVQRSKYPWLASVICEECWEGSSNANPWGHICGGSLITDR